MKSSGSLFELTSALGASDEAPLATLPRCSGDRGLLLGSAGHRETAVNMAIEVIRQAAANELPTTANDPFACEMTEIMRDWAIESLIQGAWIREYHMWERDTKDYFDGHYLRTGRPKVNWRTTRSSHVAKVAAQLELFFGLHPYQLSHRN